MIQTRIGDGPWLRLGSVMMLLLLLIAVASPQASAQTCGNWLPGPSSPDLPLNASVKSMAVSNGELFALADLYQGPTTPSTTRLFVLRSGVWLQLPWDDAALGQILLFNTDSGVPAVLTSRTISTTASTRTAEFAVRTYSGTAWATAATMQLTFSTNRPTSFFDFTLYNGDWYLAASNSANGFVYRSSGGTLSQAAITDTTSCTTVILSCVFFDPRSFRTLQVGVDGLYLGGRFESVTPTGGSTVTAKNLVRFNGTQWQALSSQPNGAVLGMRLDSTIAINNTGLVIWGNFSQVGTLSASSIARYNSFTNAWNALGAGLNGPPAALIQVQGATINSINYVAIYAYPVGLANAFGCAKWTGSAWENFGGSDISTVLNTPGSFTSGVNFSGIVVGGSGLNVNGVPRFGVSRWSGTSWDFVAPQQGTDGFSRATTVYNNDVYFGGDFTRINSVLAAHVARRNAATSAYEPLGAGVNGSVLALTSFGGELIAGGTFTTAGGNSASNVAAWNGTQWRPLGAGLDGAVRGFTVWNGSLVAVGSFRNTGTTNVGSVARWTGSAWVPVDPAFITTDLYAAATLGTTLYVGGASGLRRFNGSTFEIPGGNVAGTVYTLFPLLGSLYVGGDFATVSSPTLAYKRLARWSGTAWFPVGPNTLNDFTSGSVRSIFGTADEIFVVGEFNVVVSGGTSQATNMARFDGTAWRKLDTESSSGRVLAGTLLADRVWVVGEFNYVGPGDAPVEGFGVSQWSKAPAFASNPQPTTVCASNSTAQATFTAVPYGTPAPTLKWRKGTTPVNDSLRISGSTTPTLTIAGVNAADLGSYNCLATDACGVSTASANATLSVCPADFDCSGAKNLDDIFIYLNAWFATDPRCDVDPVPGVSLDDLFIFINIWFQGC